MHPLAQDPNALDDELVGSLLGRVAAANSLSSAGALMRWLGLSLHSMQTMDVLVLTPNWVAVASALEIDLNYLIDGLSTKPYWSTFREESETLDSQNGFATSRVPYSVLSTCSAAPTELQFCGVCLREAELGGYPPYVLRSHQLPGTHVCFKHCTRLFRRCTKCSKPVQYFLGPIRQLSYTCECGFDLRRIAPRVSADDPFFHLACFEHECLTSTLSQHSKLDAASFIRRVCQERSVTLKEVVAGAFGTSSLARRKSGSTTPLPQPTFATEHMYVPSICSALVALGFDFKGAHSSIGESGHGEYPRRQNACFRPESTPDARRELIRMKNEESVDWSSLLGEERFLFWWLFLKDFRWLQEQLGKPKNALVARTIEQDRQTIIHGTGQYQRDHATVRAWCRDREWLNESRRERAADKSEERDRVLVSRIRAAADEVFERPGRPVKFGFTAAARAAGISGSALILLHRRVRSVEYALWESPPHFRLRLLAWAFVQRRLAGKRVTQSSLLKSTGLSFRRENRFYAASVLHFLTDTEEV